MRRLDRRTLLTGAAVGMASLAGCNELSGTEENTGETVLDRTLTTSDGNPATVSFEASSASALSLEVSSNEAAVVDMFDPATGTSLGTVGEGIAVENSGRVESAAVPESTDTLTLGAAMHPDARVDVTVTDKGNGGTGEPTPVPEQVNAVRSALEETDSDRVPLVGPLWASLFAHQRERGVEIADEALDSLHAAVYGSIANQEASAWADSSIEQIASILTTATVTAVAAKTGLPAGLIEGALRDEIENVLQGENVNWSFDSATPRQLDATGGSLTVDTTLSLDLSVRNTGVTIEAPFRLEATVDGETAPASASIDDFSVLTDEVTIEDVS